VREAAIGQGATNALSAGSRGRAGPTEWSRPSGERESDWLGKKTWAAAGLKTGAGPNSSNKTFLNFI
jgi:hypothetical protein